jgi:hypothetical protein
MKSRLYLETTIPSYLTARPSKDLIIAGNQKVTKDWWQERRDSFEIFISQFVLDEAGAGDADAAKERLEVLSPFPLLDVTDAVSQLASALLQSGIIPKKAAGDAAHIAVSAVNGMEYLMTWNCAHIANAANRTRIQEICFQNGFPCPVICTPVEL